MQQISIEKLKPHPRNTEFFDDMTGEKWEEFLKSVQERGVIEPVVITQDHTIVSGHQRIRACKELGIETVMCDMHSYDNEDQIIQDLLETNIRQRGDVGGSAKKVGLRIKELERIYGIRNGSAGTSHTNNFNGNDNPKTEKELADILGFTQQTLQNYKKLTEMIPELEDLVDTGVATPTTALAIMRNLSEDEQVELISSLDTTKRITQKQVQKYIDEIRELKANPPKPADYNELKKDLQRSEQEYFNMQRQFKDKVKENQDLRKQMETLKSSPVADEYNKKLKDSAIFFCSRVADFIEKMGGYIWLTDKINEIPEYERKGYVSAVYQLKDWADAMIYNINNKEGSIE